MFLNYIKKKIIINSRIRVFFFIKANRKYFRFESVTNEIYFFSIPHFIHLEVKDFFIYLLANEVNKKQFKNFLENLTIFLKKINRICRKKLVLKGLGFKMSLSTCRNTLELKIGFSHLVKLPVDQTRIKLNINKNCITIEGNSLSFVGNFAAKLKKCKMPDIYKGKGFLYRNEKFLLKEIKKK